MAFNFLCYNVLMNEFYSGLEMWQVIVIAVLGLLFMLFGYRIKKAAFFLIWFLIGFMLMQNVMPWINSSFPDIANQDVWQFILPILGGVLLSMLGFTIEKLCVGGACFGLIMMIVIQTYGTDIGVIVAAAIIGIIVAGLAVMAMKPATIVATSAAGAYLIAAGLPFIVSGMDTNLVMPVFLLATVIGSLIQFFTTKHVS